MSINYKPLIPLILSVAIVLVAYSTPPPTVGVPGEPPDTPVLLEGIVANVRRVIIKDTVYTEYEIRYGNPYQRRLPRALIRLKCEADKIYNFSRVTSGGKDAPYALVRLPATDDPFSFCVQVQVFNVEPEGGSIYGYEILTMEGLSPWGELELASWIVIWAVVAFWIGEASWPRKGVRG